MARNQHGRRTARLAAALAGLLVLPARAASAEILEGWPCPGCVTATPPPARDGGAAPPGGPGEARPLLVALHGDGGGVRALFRAWQGAAAAAGVVVLAPRCPRELGCTAGSWWQWLATAGHDPAWLGAQIDAVAGRFPVDARRVYATGYSGGATYLGWYVPTHAERFAAVAHVAGGAAYRPPCPACKVPVLFVLGAADPMLGPYTRPLRDWYEGCGGHEISWETLPNVTHEGILQVLEAGRSRQILSWLQARPAACLAEVADADAAPPIVAAVTELPDAGLVDPPPATPMPPRVAPPVAGCACDLSRAAPPAGGVALLVGALAAARRRRREVLARRARPR